MGGGLARVAAGDDCHVAAWKICRDRIGVDVQDEQQDSTSERASARVLAVAHTVGFGLVLLASGKRVRSALFDRTACVCSDRHAKV